MPNVNNTNTISGAAMSVFLGVVCLIAPWFLPIGTFSKIIVSIIGIFLIVIGVKND
ncbi:MAG: hypothetical protein ABIH28_04190 [archaeon]